MPQFKLLFTATPVPKTSFDKTLPATTAEDSKEVRARVTNNSQR